ncbi:MAG: hypothetical protein IOC64_07070 [Methylobacterium sp.]|jgi:2'-5' RNA ligase|nr:hypothetical protein [Methylobacterium sp.]
MTSPIHSIWLMLSPQDEARFTAVMRALSARFGTPAFTPHLTVRGDSESPPDVLETLVEAAALAVPAFAQDVAGIESSDLFFRSFYAGFAVSPALASLKHWLDPDAAAEFMPHVSLLYGPVKAEAKAAAAAEFAPVIAGIPARFDRLCVVRSGQDIPIEEWTVIASRSLVAT